MSQIELISFKICPFVQRSVITLNVKNVAYSLTYIDLADKPDWFLKISPFGKVPVLRQGDTAVFESAVINEYLDETNAPSLHPEHALRRAHNRAWIEFGSSLLMSQYGLYQAADEAAFQAKWQETKEKLQRVEDQLGNGPYFNGAQFSLADAAYAPALMRFDLIAKNTSLRFFDAFPKIAAWTETLLAMQAVKDSVVPEFDALFLNNFTANDSYLPGLLKASATG